MAIVTKDSLQKMLDSEDRNYVKHVVGRALVVLFNNQTSSEQTENTTNHLNMIGFTGADGHGGCLTAKFYLKHNTLLDWQLEKWLKRGKSGYSRLTKYHKQLNKSAEIKAAKKKEAV